jgi:hypothetical protein
MNQVLVSRSSIGADFRAWHEVWLPTHGHVCDIRLAWLLSASARLLVGGTRMALVRFGGLDSVRALAPHGTR